MPFLDYDHEVRKVLYTTTIIESLNARFRQAARRRGHFPTERTPLANCVDYAVASVARWDTRVRPSGLPASQASMRVRLTAVAMRMFCTRVLASPL